MNPDMLEYALTGAAFDALHVDQLSASADGDADVLAEQPAARTRQPAFAVRSTTALWFAEVDQSLIRLAERGEDWDSYGAKAINPIAVANARRIVRELAMIEDVPKPVVGGTPDGEVAFEWDTGDWSLDLTIEPSNRLHYVYLDRIDPAREDERYTTRLDDVLVFLTQLPRR